MGIRFRVLGEFEARLDDQPIDVGHARQQCVLAVLLVEANQVVPVDQLVDRLWGDHAPHRARNTLYGYLYRLRQALARAPGIEIAHKSNGYVAVVEAETVDVHLFTSLTARARAGSDPRERLELLEQALDLWQGTPFTGLDTPWLTALGEMLSRQRFVAELDHADLALEAGRHNELLPAMEARTRQHPLDERLAAQYMLALYRSGQPAEALNQYQRTRRLLADELGMDPGEALQRLHRQVLAADRELIQSAPPPTTATATVTTPVPRQLPSPPGAFTGRAEEIGQLNESLTGLSGRGPVVISAIGGAGGVGKTWLALHWAHSQVDRFGDGQLYVNLRGFDPAVDPMQPAEALRIFLCALGVDPKTIPVDIDAQAGLYRSLAANKSMLVVLDNARDSAQVEPLLPGSPTCTVVVTSRNQLAGLVTAHGAQPVVLDVLNQSDAENLLAARVDRRRLTAEPEAVAEIITHCSGMPLALGIVASRAALRPQIPLSTFAAELQQVTTRLHALDHGDPDMGIGAVLSSSYCGLSPEHAEVFRLLGLAAGPDISVAAAAALTGQSQTKVERSLRALENVSLATQHLPGRYRMHDLIRLYARERALLEEPVASREAALRRLADFYLHTAHAADRLLDPHSPPIELSRPAEGCLVLPLADEPTALAWLDAEHVCVLAMQAAATTEGWYDKVWQIAWGLTTFHLRRGHLRDDITVWRAALKAAQHLRDRHTEALAHRMLGDTYARIGDHTSALDHLRPALSLAEQSNDLPGQAHARTALSHAWAAQGDDREALDHAVKALPLYRELTNAVWEARTLNQMGKLSTRLGEPEQGRTHCLAALELSRGNRDRHGEADALASLGYLALRSDAHAEALDYYEKALARYRELGDSYMEAETLDRMADLNATLGSHAAAVAHWREASTLYQNQHRTVEAGKVRQRIAFMLQSDVEHAGARVSD